MTAKRKKRGQLSLKLGFSDERIPKLIGIACLFIAFYLFAAFVSYLFTWHLDQDSVLRFSWGLLLQGDMEAANWLGRFGAIVSNMFFYWGFGISSFIVVVALIVTGLNRIREQSSSRLIPLYRNSLIWMVALSIFFSFIFKSSPFPWGGAFGKEVGGWLNSFVGDIGMIALFIFLVFGLLVWFTNPNFNELTLGQILQNIQFFFNDLISGKLFKTKRKPLSSSQELQSVTERKVTATKTDEVVTLKPGERTSPEEGDGNHHSDPPPSKEKPLTQGEQLALEMKEAREKRLQPKTLEKGVSDLEINAPATQPNTEEETPLTPATLLNKNPLTAGNIDHLEPYDPTLELPSYESPVLALLNDYSDQKIEIDREELEANKDQIIETLLNYKIEIIKIKATIGPTVTLYEIVPAPGVRISKIKNLEDDIALSLAALGIRIIAPIPGKGTIGIEVPNKKKQIVSLKETLRSEKFKRAKMDLPIALGKTIQNEVYVADLAKMPHLLIAGATGQGKSVGLNVILMSLLYKRHPSQIKFVLIDPKKVELFPYAKIENHFLAYLPNLDDPIVTDTTKVVHTLNSLLIEMDERYNLLKKAQSRNIKEYNKKFVARRLNPEKGHRFLPWIILVIDEFADLIMTAGKEIELPIGRLAQLSRAVGIHLIIATQRPSVNIITGVIKANFPARMAFKVTAKVDSRTILDTGGADRLIGRGDMLLSFGSNVTRLQCAFVDTPEVEQVINFIAEQPGYPEPYFLPEFHGDDGDGGSGSFSKADMDDMMPEAARLVVQNQHGSTSMIQRRLRLGYNRAGRIMDQLEALGVVGPSEGSKAREVLIYDEVELERYLSDILNRK